MNANLDDVPPSRLLLAASVVAIVVGVLTVSLWWFTNLGLLLVTVMSVAVIALGGPGAHPVAAEDHLGDPGPGPRGATRRRLPGRHAAPHHRTGRPRPRPPR